MKTAKILFLAGSWILLVSGIMHFIGQFGGKSNAQMYALTLMMKDYRRTSMGMTFSLWDVMQAWGVAFGMTLVFFGLQNLLISRTLASDSEALRRAAAVSGVCAMALVGMAFYYQVAPPAMLLAPAVLCFGVSAILASD